jgi:hypothetical protein
MKSFLQILEELGHKTLYPDAVILKDPKDVRTSVSRDDVTREASEKLHAPQEMSPEEIHSVHSYIGGRPIKVNTYLTGLNGNKIPSHKDYTGYDAINGHLRGHQEYPEVEANHLNHYIRHIDSAIAKHKTEDDLHTWRAIAKGIPSFDSLKPGDTFHDKGFVSTTVKPSYISNWSQEYSHKTRIHVPKGSNALAINKYSDKFNNDYEHEVILPRNAKFRYEGLYSDEGTPVHHLTYLGVHHEKT